TVRSTSINFYGTSNLRASDTTVTADDALAMSISYSKEFDLTTVGTITASELVSANLTNRTGKTFFLGEKGEEIADYSVNYKKSTATVRSTSINFHVTPKLRASDTTVTADDALAMSISYSKEFDLT